MEVRSGYKQSEVGVIPDEWEVARITDVADVKTGPYGSALHERDYVDDGTPIITVEHLGELGMMHVNLPLVSDADRKRLRAYLLDAGDIVFSRVGSVDRNALIRKSEAGWLFSGRLLRVRPYKSKVFAPYLSYQFHSEPFKRRVHDVAVGQTMASINTQILNNITIILPILQEQRAIAAVIGDADALIAGLERLIVKKRDLKQAVMQELLTGKKRLPGFSGEWKEKPLGEIASATKGTQLHSSETSENGRFGHLNGGITPSGYAKRANTPGGTIAISEGGNSCGYVQFMAEPYWCGGHCYSVVPRGIDNGFLYHALKARQTSIMALRVGSGLPNVQKTALLAFKLTFPASAAEQAAIAAVLSDMDAEIAALEDLLSKTRALKQGMMQELLTGRTRLAKLSHTKET